MSKRPELTVAQITEQFDVSRSTVRRGINNGRFPNATKDHHGRWLIPVDDVLNAGYKPRKTWLNEGGHDHGQGSQNPVDANKQAVVTDHGRLKNELAHERAQVDKLKALLEAERAHVESLRMALRMIEPSKSNATEKSTSIEETPLTPMPQQQQYRRPGLLQRLFRQH